jgi:hypothetical protein
MSLQPSLAMMRRISEKNRGNRVLEVSFGFQQEQAPCDLTLPAVLR